MSETAIAQTQSGSETERYVAAQAQKQAASAPYSGRQPLDFAPFAAALDALSEADLAALHSLVFETSLCDLSRALADGRLSAERLTLYYLHRLRRDDGHLNTVIQLNPHALEVARALDAERAAGTTRGPLHGLPITLKANIGTADALDTTAGALVLHGLRARSDAPLAARLRAAGAVFLGKANLSEWANFYSHDSVNGFSQLGGQTRSPYGVFDVGGSSAGSAAGVAANLTAASIGSETTGSLVYPASQNAIVTIKPTVGLISRVGIIPITDAFDTAGPMTRSVRDAALLLNALVTPLAEAESGARAARALLGMDFTAALRADWLVGLRVGLVQRAKEVRTGDADLREQAAAHLAQAGAVIIDVPPLESQFAAEDYQALSDKAFEVLLCGYRLGVEAYLAASGAATRTLAEIVAFNAVDRANRVPYGQDIIERAAALTADDLARYPALVSEVRAAYLNALRACLNTHQADLLADFSNYASPFFARAGGPAVTVPSGYRTSGEPLGLTFFGDRLHDQTVIGAAYAFEQTAQARRPPPLGG
jgi:amidase